MADWNEIRDFLQPKEPPYCPEAPSLTQKVFLRSNAIEGLFGGKAGGGKMVLYNTPIATSDGFVPIKDIHPGDIIFGMDGNPTLVLAEHTETCVDGWLLTFDDGSQITAHDDHLWLTYSAKELADLLFKSDEWRENRRKNRPPRATGSQGEWKTLAVGERNSLNPPKTKPLPTGTIRTTAEMVETMTVRNGSRANHAIPVCGDVMWPERDLPIDPYILGVWLGDGTSGEGAITSMDDQIIEEVERLGYPLRRINIKEDNRASTFTFENLRVDLKNLGLLGNKHIPDIYLYSSPEQRLALIQGLLDTDGNVAKSSVEFSNKNKGLVEGLAILARSLGMKVSEPRLKKVKAYPDNDYWTLKFAANRKVFRLERKAATQKIAERKTTRYRYLKSAERVHGVDMKCLRVSAEDGMFLAGTSFIPTHNSSALLMSALQFPLDVNTVVPTTEGWTTIGDIEVGQYVFDEFGKPCSVLDKTDRFVGDCYEVEFGNGERLIADANHVWPVHSFQDRMAEGGTWYPSKRPLQNLTTAQLAETLLTEHKKPKMNWSIPPMGEIDLPEIELPVDPYLLGVWLGDGTHKGGTIAGIDTEIREAFTEAGYVVKVYDRHHYHVKGLISQIRSLGLFGDKHVPEQYLRGSAKQRLSLLQGLMDTDGTVGQYGGCRFFNTNERLADAAYELVASLGANPRKGTSGYITPSGEQKRGFYIDWPSPFIAFRLERKAAKQILRKPRERMIRSVSKVSDRAVQCLIVDSPTRLFAIGKSFMLTHNCDVPGYNAMIFRRTFADLALPSAIMDRFIQWMAEYPEVRFNHSTYTGTFPSGARITFGYLNNRDDYLRYKGPCHPDCEVLTKSGWVPIGKVQVGDSVASLDPSNRETSFQSVTHVWEYDHDGDLIVSLPGKDVAFAMTPDHTVWGSTQRKPELRRYRADEIPTVFSMPQAGFYGGGVDPGEFVFDSPNKGRSQYLRFSSLDFAEFLGWFIAEGCLNMSDPSSIKISQHAVNQDNVDRIMGLLRRSGANPSHQSGRDICFGNAALYAYLRGCGHGAKEKRVPREVIETWNAELLEQLLWALVEGDGTWRNTKTGNGQFVTTSEVLADQVMEIAARTGYRATLDERPYVPKHNFGLEGRSFHVHLLKRAGVDTQIGWSKEKPASMREHYEGKVYCLTVPPHHTFLVRYKGRMHYTGNSELQFIGFDEVTEIRESDYRYMFSRLRRPSIGPLSEVPLRVRAASNPAPNWVRQRFIIEGKQEGRIFVPSSFEENPGVDTEAYRKSLARLDPVERRRLEFGDWFATNLGSVFIREEFQIIDPGDVPSLDIPGVTAVRFWDFAATEDTGSNDPDWTVGTLAYYFGGTMYVVDVRRVRFKPDKVEDLVARTAHEDGVRVAIRMEQEPGSSGKVVVDQFARYVVPQYDFRGVRATGDKETRARPYATAVANGRIMVARGAWLTDWLDEHASFPEACEHDDQVDSATGAFVHLTGLGGPMRKQARLLL